MQVERLEEKYDVVLAILEPHHGSIYFWLFKTPPIFALNFLGALPFVTFSTDESPSARLASWLLKASTSVSFISWCSVANLRIIWIVFRTSPITVR